MLPDFPKVKDKLALMLYYEFNQDLSSHLGPIANVPVSLVFEGNKTILIRADGSEEMDPKKATAKLKLKCQNLRI